MNSAPKETFIASGVTVIADAEVFWVDYLNEDLEHPRLMRAEFGSQDKADEFVANFNVA
jgi:hypothetical protein